MRRALLVVLPLAAACAGCGGGASPAATVPAREATVRRVVDGDTLIARVDGVDERVRLLGVDAPESVTPDRPVECFGPQAGAHLKALLPAARGWRSRPTRPRGRATGSAGCSRRSACRAPPGR